MRLTPAVVLLAGCLITPLQPAPRVAGGEPPPPSQPPEMQRGEVDPHLVGCWLQYNYRDGRTGDQSYKSTLELRADGTYQWRVFPWGSSSDKGLPAFDERGQWGVDGGALGVFPDQGPPTRRAISFQNDSFQLDGVKQFTCT